MGAKHKPYSLIMSFEEFVCEVVYDTVLISSTCLIHTTEQFNLKAKYVLFCNTYKPTHIVKISNTVLGVSISAKY